VTSVAVINKVEHIRASTTDIPLAVMETDLMKIGAVDLFFVLTFSSLREIFLIFGRA
jgi:hypothetical protein